MAGRFWEASAGRVWVGRLETGDDLVEEIERVCAEHDVRAAWVSAIGAVKHGSFAYYAVVQAPFYRYVNEAQLAPKAGLVAGVSRSF